ncbi:hypothetical protein BH09PSE5_BH09PSE5_05410 [soil metagenome]
MQQRPSADEEYEALIQFLYLAPVGLVQISVDGEIVMINPISAQLLMPLSRDGSLSNLFDALEPLAPDLRHLVADFGATHGMVCDGMRLQVNAGTRNERGGRDPQVLSLTVLKLDEQRLMAVLSDISVQVKRERLLKQNEAWLNAVLTGISDYALVNLDSQGLVADWNSSISRVTGLSREAVLGQPFTLFTEPDASTPERLSDRLRDADANGWSLEDGWHLRADGTRFWGSAMIAPLKTVKDSPVFPADALMTAIRGEADQDEAAYCLVIRDITDRREASELQRKSISCDYLTGIANRRAFFEAAELEMGRWRRAPRELSMIIFDADHFKRINDSYGHPGGDVVLKHFADVLSSTFRQVDTVARIGGEEFAALLPSTSLQDAVAVAERVRTKVGSQPAEFDGKLIRYTISAGVATMDSSTSGFDELMKRADAALYSAKRAARDQVSGAAAQRTAIA